MNAAEIIAKIRDQNDPSAQELGWFADGLATGQVSDAQAGAFAMAVCLNGLGGAGRIALTQAMRDSGDVLVWDFDGPVIDKHSTGGIGDCVSLLLAPMLAACGVYVPMISGKGLGHTGGTLDKLAAIPGLSTEVDVAKLRRITAKTGCAIVGATGQIAPADRKLYGVRDVTGTVESIDLITASILSKKLAAGLDGLVLDVKMGSGAFMKTLEDATELATALVDTANGAGCKTRALISDMNQPLAPALGNAVEVAICMEVLSGDRDAAPALRDLTLSLGEAVLEGHINDPRKRLEIALSSGEAMLRFAQMVAELGGPPDMAADWRAHLPQAPVIGDVLAAEDGHIAAIDGRALGMCVVAMGGGRRVEIDRIDPRVGITDICRLGAKVSRGDPLAVVHAADEDSAEQAAKAIRAAITIGEAPDKPPLIHSRIS